MQNDVFIKKLTAIYNQGNLIPFIGNGLSRPFNVPNLENLIRDCAKSMGIEDINGNGLSMLDAIEFNLANHDYWEAIRTIKVYLNRSDDDIREYIVERLNNSILNEVEDHKHNYSDLSKYNFNIYFTINYDSILQRYLETNFMPINLKDVNQSIQNIVSDKDAKRIFHLHGSLNETSSMVISKENYEELYNNQKYNILFSLFSGAKTFLFLGISFNDIFIQKILKENIEFFKSKHYIILSQPTNEQITYLKNEYNIETLSYDPNNSSHSEAIREMLGKICITSGSSSDKNSIEFDEDVLDIVPSNEKKRELEKSLFCRKLRLEEVGNIKVDYSKDCFFTAEQYFRWLKKSGIQNNEIIAQHLLDLSYMKYKEIMIDEFEEKKNSDEFLKSVHKSLKKLEYTKLNKIINQEKMPNEVNKQGFIHVLANYEDTEKEVWWGEKRFE